jgi:transposase
VRDHAGDYPSEHAAIKTVTGRLGRNPETQRKWLRQAEVDGGEAEGTTTAAAREIPELKRKNAELDQTIEILKAATSPGQDAGKSAWSAGLHVKPMPPCS